MKNKFWLLLLCIHFVSVAVVAQTSAKRQQVLQVTTGGFISFKSETSTIDNKPAANSQSLKATHYSKPISD